jgi:hypothetical protein
MGKTLVSEFAEAVGYTRQGIVGLCRRAGIPLVTIGGRVCFRNAADAEELRAALRMLGLIASHRAKRSTNRQASGAELGRAFK